MNAIAIRTKRLVIKDLELADAETVYHYRSNDDISRYQSFSPGCMDDVNSFIIENTKQFNIQDNWYQVGVFYNQSVIGDIGIHFIGPDNTQCEIGYTIGKEHQKQGFGKEAVMGILDYLFNVLNKHRVVASLNPCNVASIALLESIGFRREARFLKSIYNNGEWEDDMWFGILKEEWKEKTAVDERRTSRGSD